MKTPSAANKPKMAVDEPNEGYDESTKESTLPPKPDSRYSSKKRQCPWMLSKRRPRINRAYILKAICTIDECSKAGVNRRQNSPSKIAWLIFPP